MTPRPRNWYFELACKSLDLNPIENLGGILARQVFGNRRRFEDKEMLWCAVNECCKAIFNETLLNLINSMHNPCVDVLFLYSHIINMHIYTYTCRIHIDAIIKTSEDFFRKIYLSLYWKGCVWDGVGDWTKTATYWPPQPLRTSPCVVLVLLGCSTGGPWAHTAGCGLSLPHLVTNGSSLQNTDFLSSPSYIIVQSPTQYLWNGMFDRHQAEITVMQFTGHSLPVHQSDCTVGF